MVKRKFLSFLAAALTAITISACGPKNTKVVFTDAQLGLFNGTFVSEAGLLTVTNEGAILKNDIIEVALTNKAVKGTGFATELSYTSSDNKNITLSWSEGSKKQAVLSCAGETESFTFKPSLASAQGWYTGYGDANYYNVVYIVTNDFDAETGLFNVAMASASYGFYDTANYADSYFTEAGKLGWDFYYASDLTEATAECYVEQQENGKIDLMMHDGEDFWFESSVAMFNFTFFKEEEAESGLYQDGLFFSSIDEDEKTVYVGWDDEASSYVEGHDANGSFVTVGDMKIRGTRYGVTVETAEGIVERPYLDSTGFNAIYDVEFSKGDSTICYTTDWDTWADTALIDGVAADSFAFAIVNHKMAITATKGEDEYVLLPLTKNESVTVVKNGVSAVYINVPLFKDLFVKDFYMANAYVFSVSDELVITIAGSIQIQASLDYNEDYGVVLVFDGEVFSVTGNMIAKALDADCGLYAFMSEADPSVSGILVEKAYVESFYGDWTTGSININISAAGVKYGASKLINGLGFTYLTNSMGELMPAIYKQGGQYIAALVAGQGVVLYQINSTTGALGLVGSFVPKDMFAAAVGTYEFSGKYGIEKVVLEANGTLTIDTSNESGTGIVPVTYTYNAILYNGKVTLIFTYKEVSVSVSFDTDGIHCAIFDIVYLRDAYFDNQGVYTDGTNIFTVVESKVSFNGKVMTVTSAGVSQYEGTVDGNTVVVTFSTNSVSIVVGEAEAIVLPKTDISLTTFAGKYTNVSDLGYDVEIKADGIYWGMTGGTLSKLSVAHTFELDAGEVVLKFSYAGIDYTAKVVEGTVVVTGKSNIPVPPPMPVK